MANEKFMRWDQMPGERKQKVLQELLQGGYGAEIRTNHEFSRCGYETAPQYYLDKDENKSREIDIYAYRNREVPMHINGSLGLFYRIIGEVKSHCTWIVGSSTRNEEQEGAFVRYEPRWYSSYSKERPLKWSDDDEIVEGCLCGGDFCASIRSLSVHHLKSFRKDQDAWYTALVSVIKACFSIEYPFLRKGDEQQCSGNLYATIPLIVLDGNLLRVVHDSDISLVACEHVQVNATYSTPAYGSINMSVHVIEIGYLPTFLEMVTAAEERGICATQRIVTLLNQERG